MIYVNILIIFLARRHSKTGKVGGTRRARIFIGTSAKQERRLLFMTTKKGVRGSFSCHVRARNTTSISNSIACSLPVPQNIKPPFPGLFMCGIPPLKPLVDSFVSIRHGACYMRIPPSGQTPPLIPWRIASRSTSEQSCVVRPLTRCECSLLGRFVRPLTATRSPRLMK